MAKPILVTGATGLQGSALIDNLLLLDPDSTRFTILALTRDPSTPKAARLLAKAPPGRISLIQGNLDDVPSVFAAAKSALRPHNNHIWGVYSVQVSLGRGVTSAGEIAQGKALIDGAIANGVDVFVYTSGERGGDEVSWDTETPVPHFASKYHIERHLKEVTAEGKPGTAMAWTVFRPVAFMENITVRFPAKMFVAALKNYLGRSGQTLQWIAVADIGVFSAQAFVEPEKWKGRAVGLAGDDLTVEQLHEAFVRATGAPAPSTWSIFGTYWTQSDKEMRLMMEWFAVNRYGVDIAELKKEHPGLLTMEEWVAQKSPFAVTK
ncbi:hypothetical protein C8A05DRAFT_46515 [Staphylotrichum tortipilum]|uniref:NmrA-like domain-containing protein n=1 Tax=Staphylotrichum tortipilum TaxID=2831512 RepID=A0AAN6RQN7_9PEZI|nr:hypothetical protein C8A05DRAFT_46515 [Staphylotrichum longicolle]